MNPSSRSEEGRPRVVVSGTSGYVDFKRVYRKLDEILKSLKDPIICTRAWWQHERKGSSLRKKKEALHLGAEYAAECWAEIKQYTVKRFHPHEKGGRQASLEELVAYCTARRPCFAVFYGVDDSCRELLALCKKNKFEVRIVKEA